jgi:hypothetical protein
VLAAKGRETDAVLASVGCAEGEFAFCAAVLVDDAVVIVEGLINGNANALNAVNRPRLVVSTRFRRERGSCRLQCLVWVRNCGSAHSNVMI